ncbi:MAG: hypothetical protein C0601_02650 [Candidatus Muiribacterium halophilum]|uniref:Carboxypeptidase regulatory-like domain-containing protein n=1 Tax=Muiribacterium halophilum TaxID=2053465 RepID=A0A2N5ZK77_MUIH1|nr:MAG: hypothetical protein C0601_02650 [Candidatus Muirbacterium halophilum]
MKNLRRVFSITVVLAFLVFLGCGGGGSLEVTPTDIAGNSNDQSTNSITDEQKELFAQAVPSISFVESDIRSQFNIEDLPDLESAPSRKAAINATDGNYFCFTVNPNYTSDYDSVNDYDILKFDFVMQWLDKPYGDPSARVIQGRQYIGTITYRLYYDENYDYTFVPAALVGANPAVEYKTPDTYVYGYVYDPIVPFRIEGADVIVSMAGYQYGVVKTDSKGYFAIPVFTTDTYENYVVSVMRDGFEVYSKSFNNIESHLNLGTIYLNPKPIIGNTVKGRARIDGSYATGATLYLCEYDPAIYDVEQGLTPIVAQAVLSDENGYFTITNVPPGEYGLCIMVNGYITYSDYIDLTSYPENGETIDVGDVYGYAQDPTDIEY